MEGAGWGAVQFADLQVFKKMILCIEHGPVEPFQAIEEVPFQEIVPEEIIGQGYQYGGYGFILSFSCRLAGGEGAVTFAFFIPLSKVGVAVV